jgi:hypothetical protein
MFISTGASFKEAETLSEEGSIAEATAATAEAELAAVTDTESATVWLESCEKSVEGISGAVEAEGAEAVEIAASEAVAEIGNSD